MTANLAVKVRAAPFVSLPPPGVASPQFDKPGVARLIKRAVRVLDNGRIPEFLDYNEVLHFNDSDNEGQPPGKLVKVSEARDLP